MKRETISSEEEFKTQISFCKRMEKLGVSVRFSTTKNVQYQHGYITDGRGVSLGRVIFFKGAYSHVKWYKHARGASYLQFALINMIRYNVIIKRGFYEELLNMAEKKSELDLVDKMIARSRLPPKKRRPLEKPNPLKYLKLPEEYRVFGDMYV